MLNVKINIRIKDKNLFKRLSKQKAGVEVGWFEDQKYEAIDKPFYSNVAKPDGKPRRYSASKEKYVATVAMANEYGVPEKKIPPRPFMKRTVEGNSRKWKKFIKNDIANSKKPDLQNTLNKLTTKVINDIQTTINELMYPPNAESTIRKKGFNNPLVDTGTMRDTVTWRESE